MGEDMYAVMYDRYRSPKRLQWMEGSRVEEEGEETIRQVHIRIMIQYLNRMPEP